MTQDAYFEALGVTTQRDCEIDQKKLQEAYIKAHDIRKFEIEMYWRRSSYLWALQGAALGGLAVISTTATNRDADFVLLSIFQADQHPYLEHLRLVVLLAIWSFGAFSAYIWILLLRGAKFWQNNWERHVDFLEDSFSGALYKTYPVKSCDPPYSVSKLNELMAIFAFFMWLIIGAASSLIILGPNAFLVIIIPSVLFIFFLAWFFDACLKMNNFGSPVTNCPSIGRDTKDTYVIAVREAPTTTVRK